MLTVLVAINKISSLPILGALGDDIAGRADDVLSFNQAGGGAVDALPEFINTIIRFAIPVGAFSMFMLMGYGGFKMISSQGNPDQINEAKEVITNALIGFAMIALSAVILLLINNVLNLNISA